MNTKLTLVSKGDNSAKNVADRLGRLEKALRGPAMQKALNAGGAVLMKAVKKNVRKIKYTGLLQQKVKIVRRRLRRAKVSSEGWVGIGVEDGEFEVMREGRLIEAMPAKYANIVEHGGHFGPQKSRFEFVPRGTEGRAARRFKAVEHKLGKYTPPRPLFKAALSAARADVGKAVLASLDKQIIAAIKKGRAR